MVDDDGELMLRYARGDLRAFEVLYSRQRGPLYRYIARLVRDRSVADDLFQEVWSRVVAHRGSYEPRARFGTFLFRIAHNCCVDHLRRAAARAPSATGGDEEALEQDSMMCCAPESDWPETRAAQAQLLGRYRMALASLPAEQRDVFLLYEQSGLSLEEIASITGVGAETAKSRLRYAVAKLRSALAASEAPARDVAARNLGACEATAPGVFEPSIAGMLQLAGGTGP